MTTFTGPAPGRVRPGEHRGPILPDRRPGNHGLSMTIGMEQTAHGPRTMTAVRTWRAAMQAALYGPEGFFMRHAPAGHFRTSATASPLFATAIARAVEQLDVALGGPRRLDIVDVGAGRGELLLGIEAALPPGLRERARFTAVELAPRPQDLPDRIDWTAKPPPRIRGLLVATEWLDNVPLDVVEVDDTGRRRLVVVDPATGREALGGPVAEPDNAWLDRWWPVTDPGCRAEIGHPRDSGWAWTVSRVERGLALAVDYGHLASGRPAGGTLTGFRYGRQVMPVPDGSCDVTAHVAVDAVASAGAAVAAQPPVLVTQRQALRALGIAGTRPPLSLAGTDPGGYVRKLAAATEAAELTDPEGLGGHYWVMQPIGVTFQPLG